MFACGDVLTLTIRANALSHINIPTPIRFKSGDQLKWLLRILHGQSSKFALEANANVRLSLSLLDKMVVVVVYRTLCHYLNETKQTFRVMGGSVLGAPYACVCVCA